MAEAESSHSAWGGGHAFWGTDIMKKGPPQNPARHTASLRPRRLPSQGAAWKTERAAQGMGGGV